jgi:hypothetical protein
MEIDINYWAVIVAAIASIVIGSLWYGKLFMKPWMEMMGFTPESMERMSMTSKKAYIIQIVASLVMALVLAKLIDIKVVYALINSTDFSALKVGLSTGFLVWLGFVVPTSLSIVLWEGKPWKLWFINSSNYLVTLLVMGAILSVWQ